jgi:hypothetical protein
MANYATDSRCNFNRHNNYFRYHVIFWNSVRGEGQMLKLSLKGVCEGCKYYQPDKRPICKKGFVKRYQPTWCTPEY